MMGSDINKVINKFYNFSEKCQKKLVEKMKVNLHWSFVSVLKVFCLKVNIVLDRS